MFPLDCQHSFQRTLMMTCGHVTRLVVSWIGEFTILCDKPKGHRGRHVRPAQYDGPDPISGGEDA